MVKGQRKQITMHGRNLEIVVRTAYWLFIGAKRRYNSKKWSLYKS